MCKECYGIYACPICGTDDIDQEELDQQELDQELYEADRWYDEREVKPCNGDSACLRHFR